jgi:hypothetical protein
MHAGGQPSEAASARQLVARMQSKRTLFQPNSPPNLPLLQVRVPLVVLWTPERIPTPKIIPPAPQKAIATVVPPSLTPPNHETHVADVKLAASTSNTATIPLAAGTTSPIVLPGSRQVQVPQTVSKSAALPTPVTVLSASNLLMPQGTVVLPLAQQTGSGAPSDMVSQGVANNASNAIHGNVKGNQEGAGAGGSSGGPGRETAANGSSGGKGVGAGGGSRSGAGNGASTGAARGNPFAVDRVEQAKDGNFGVVVIGTSLAEEYPETMGIWAGRLTYTVYLHVGLTKNWILQYALPQKAKAADGARLAAPWPYLIVRPHLMPTDLDADAIMVHGFINAGGRFEQLAIVFPPQFAQTKFVLGSLQQWQFRPAMQNGQQTPVEVLLIIPDEGE